MTLFVFLMPAGGLKNACMRWLGHSIAHGVQVAPCVVVNVRRFELGQDVRIGGGNMFRGLDLVALGKDARIGHWNWISAGRFFLDRGAEHCMLRLSNHATIVSRHFIDCAGGVFIHEYAVLAGLRSVLLTHQIDYRTCTQTTKRITIGSYSLVNACNKLVPGASVPARCVTTLGAVILPGLQTEGRLYGGVPARDIQPVDGAWFSRTDARIKG